MSSKNMLIIQELESMNTARIFYIEEITQAFQRFYAEYMNKTNKLSQLFTFNLQDVIQFYSQMQDIRFIQRQYDNCQPLKVNNVYTDMYLSKTFHKDQLLNVFTQHYVKQAQNNTMNAPNPQKQLQIQKSANMKQQNDSDKIFQQKQVMQYQKQQLKQAVIQENKKQKYYDQNQMLSQMLNIDN